MADFKTEFERLGPWVTRFELEGVFTDGHYDALADRRLDAYFDRFPHVDRILELGCLEGGHTRALADRCEEVVAVDARSENIVRAQFIHSQLGITNSKFLVADLEKLDVETLGEFDVVFNVGLLYHLPEPWRLLQSLAPIGRSMFLWTHVAPARWRNTRRGGYKGELYTEGGRPDPLSGMSPTSFWPTLSELERMLRRTGYCDIDILERDDSHPHGPAVLLTCQSVKILRAERAVL